MKLAIILITACAILFVMVRLTKNACPTPDPTARDFTPPSWTSALADLPFGPGLGLKIDTILLAAGKPESIEIPRDAGTLPRVGKFALSSGKAVVITYTCRDPSRKGCDQHQQCLVAQGAARPTGCASDSRAKARIAVLDVGGSITLNSVEGPATVHVR